MKDEVVLFVVTLYIAVSGTCQSAACNSPDCTVRSIYAIDHPC